MLASLAEDWIMSLQFSCDIFVFMSPSALYLMEHNICDFHNVVFKFLINTKIIVF
jgi:hypothetical protein